MKNPVVEKSFQLAIEIVKFSSALKEQKHFDLSSQVFRSGTSIGSNIREAQSAESRKDFIHKMKIAAKEAEELDYWMAICKESDLLQSPPKQITDILLEVKKLLSSIISKSVKALSH